MVDSVNMDAVTKRTAAVLVDYDYYRQNVFVREFVYRRKGNASLVALVSSPDAQHPDNDPNEFEWDVTITNVKAHPDEVFKLAALNALTEHSNLIPVIAVDLFNGALYDEAGVLLTLDGGYFG